MTAGGRAGDLVRRVVLPRIHLIPGVRDKIVNSSTPALHRSALVMKSPACRLPGTLCSNPVLAEGKRFDTVVGPRFAIVTSTPLSRRLADEVNRRGAVVITAQPDTELARWLQSGRSTAAVVRPDGTVLRAGRDVDEICGAVPVFATAKLADA
jgi:3-(3-hydroxy-phenyl)propionate hydroxylase